MLATMEEAAAVVLDECGFSGALIARLRAEWRLLWSVVDTGKGQHGGGYQELYSLSIANKVITTRFLKSNFDSLFFIKNIY